MIRVLVADDSRTARALLVDILARDPKIRVVGQAKDGVDAVEMAVLLKPDLIMMDLYMPRMNGLEATARIMEVAPTRIVMITSARSSAEVSLSLSATQLGALTLLAKPEGPGSEQFREESERLLATIRAMSAVKVVRRWRREPAAPRVVPSPAITTPRSLRVVAIAASTGGPAALQKLLGALGPQRQAPILVVQHIAPGFIGPLTTWLGSSCGLPVVVAASGELAAAGTVYVAPDHHHLGIAPDGRLLLSGDPPIEGFRPSASHLFESVVQAYGSNAATVLLTGMGRDGVDGLVRAYAAGAYVLAQDQASSVVYGMPGEASKLGVVHEELSPELIGARLAQLLTGVS